MAIEGAPVHWLSKEARRRIIELMLSSRSVSELSALLGVSRTAIRKYVSGETHPSDEVMARALGALAPYEAEAALRIMMEDLAGALERLHEVLPDNLKAELRKIVTGALRLEEAAAGHR
ncbi:MAG: helix-turn-helix transcriptional regulator [Desulfurococcaceae archaeon]